MTSTLKENPIQFRLIQSSAIGLTLKPSSKKRDWLSPHAYKCFPISTANRFGWDFVLPSDVVYEWTGGHELEDVTVIEGGEFTKSQFSMGTLTFTPRHQIETPPGVHSLIMPIPNQDVGQELFTSMSAIVETDIVDYPSFVTIRLLKPGKFTIPKGTPIARLMPIHLSDGNDISIIEVEATPEDDASKSRIADKREVDPDVWTKDYQDRMRYKSGKFPEPVREVSDYRNVAIVPDFLSSEECSLLIEAFKSGDVPQDQSDQYWKGRCFWMDFPGKLDSKINELIPAMASEFFREPVKITNPHVVKWPEGFEMPSHSDYGRDGEYPEREYAAILYLNDDYDGGDVYFPEIDDGVITPLAGMLVMFAGGKLEHGVTKVTKGDRYTVASWLERGN